MDTSSIATRRMALADLLSGSASLVIPDMQRDFCWGADKTAVLVEGIMRLYADRRPYVLGLLYGFEQPADSRQIHIIDGQQRLTVMYLMLGMLYRRTPRPWLKELLVSPSDGEPKLVYQARREALYFISDLVAHFFLDRDGRLSMLEQSRWFYASYNADTTVRSLIGAIRSIDTVFDAAEGIDFDDFAHFLAHSVTFLYCSLPDAPTAERMFITINTTGEPLTPAQRLRAQTIAADPSRDVAIGHIWNEMEDFFWGTGEATIDDFVALWPGADIDELHSRFRAYTRLASAIGLQPKDYPTVPCVAFAMRWPEAGDADLRRIWRFFSNVARYQRPGKNEDELASKLVAAMPSPDILSILDLGRAHERYANDEEREKLSLIRANPPRRHEAEAVLALGEDHPMLNGRMARLIDWGKGDIDAIRAYVDAIYRIWGTDIDCNESLDPVRRSLLCIGHRGYPIVRRGDSVLSLCWNDYDWQRLMLLSPGAVRQLIDNPGERRVDKNHPYYELIINPALLANCRKRRLQRPCEAFIGIYDLSLGRTRWLVDQIEMPQPQGWSQIRAYGTRCLYTDHLRLNAVLDLYYQPTERSPYRVELFARPDSAKPPVNLKPLAHLLGNNAKYDHARNRFVAYFPTAAAALRACARLFYESGLS